VGGHTRAAGVPCVSLRLFPPCQQCQYPLLDIADYRIVCTL
jgi:hypothetical protein